MKSLQKSCEQLVDKSLTSCELLAADYIAVTIAKNYYSGCRVYGVWCRVVPLVVKIRLTWIGLN